MPYNYQEDFLGVSSFGVPGLGFSLVAYPGDAPLTSLELTFTDLPQGVTIAPVDNSNSYATRFRDTTAGIFFDGVISPGGDSVTFTAPAGAGLDPGDLFFFNVVFTGDAGPSVDFTGTITTAAVPEPASLVMMAGGGLALMGCGLRRRKAKVAA